MHTYEMHASEMHVSLRCMPYEIHAPIRCTPVRCTQGELDADFCKLGRSSKVKSASRSPAPSPSLPPLLPPAHPRSPLAHPRRVSQMARRSCPCVGHDSTHRSCSTRRGLAGHCHTRGQRSSIYGVFPPGFSFGRPFPAANICCPLIYQPSGRLARRSHPPSTCPASRWFDELLQKSCSPKPKPRATREGLAESVTESGIERLT
jgi:hypothetical protein